MELKNNIKQRWWRDMVHGREDVVGLDSSIIASPKVWEASGHVAGFVDPMVDCKVSKLRYRADQLFYAKVRFGGWLVVWRVRWCYITHPSVHQLCVYPRPPYTPLCVLTPSYPKQVELLDDGEVVGYVSMLDSGDLHADAEKQAAKLVKKAGKQGQAIKKPFEIKV